MILMIEWFDISYNTPTILSISIIYFFNYRSLGPGWLYISLNWFDDLHINVIYFYCVLCSTIFTLNNSTKGTITQKLFNFISIIQFFSFSKFIMRSLMSFCSWLRFWYRLWTWAAWTWTWRRTRRWRRVRSRLLSIWLWNRRISMTISFFTNITCWLSISTWFLFSIIKKLVLCFISWSRITTFVFSHPIIIMK